MLTRICFLSSNWFPFYQGIVGLLLPLIWALGLGLLTPTLPGQPVPGHAAGLGYAGEDAFPCMAWNRVGAWVRPAESFKGPCPITAVSAQTVRVPYAHFAQASGQAAH